MADNEDGSYTVRYHTTLLGQYSVHISACSVAYMGTHDHKKHLKPLADSPWNIYSLDGPCCPGQTTASGPGVSGACNAQEPMVFIVEVRDKYGNRCQRYDASQHKLEVSARPPFRRALCC